jgi:hypothetical protein
MCAAGNDTPLVTFDCTFVSVNHSPNVKVDVTDSGVKIDDNEDIANRYRKCCCLLWRRRRVKCRENENETMRRMTTFREIPLI